MDNIEFSNDVKHFLSQGLIGREGDAVFVKMQPYPIDNAPLIQAAIHLAFGQEHPIDQEKKSD